MTNTKELLIKTKTVLEQRGRTTATLIDRSTGCACLLGAVGIATIGEEFEIRANSSGYALLDSSPEAEAVIQALTEQVPSKFRYSSDIAGEPVWRFNDLTTGEGSDELVFALIDQAIDAA